MIALVADPGNFAVGYAKSAYKPEPVLVKFIGHHSKTEVLGKKLATKDEPEYAQQLFPKAALRPLAAGPFS